MTIDWGATGQWMQAWAGFAQVGAVIYVGRKGAGAFEGWRRQKIEERRIEEAERLLSLTYRCRRAYSAIRSPLMDGASLQAAEQRLEASGALANVLERNRRSTIHAQAIYDRINAHAATWDEVLKAMPVAAALFGPEIEDALESLLRSRSIISVSAESYATDAGGDAAFTHQIRDAIWEGYGRVKDGDTLATAIDVAVKRVEAVLKPILRADAADMTDQ